MVLANWAGNYTFRAPELRYAGSITDVQSIVASVQKVRVLGSGHSFKDIADSDGVQLSLQGFNRVLPGDADRRLRPTAGATTGATAS